MNPLFKSHISTSTNTPSVFSNPVVNDYTWMNRLESILRPIASSLVVVGSSVTAIMITVATIILVTTVVMRQLDFLTNRINPFYDPVNPLFKNDSGVYLHCSGQDTNVCSIPPALANINGSGNTPLTNISSDIVFDTFNGLSQTVNNALFRSQFTNISSNVVYDPYNGLSQTDNNALFRSQFTNISTNVVYDPYNGLNQTANNALFRSQLTGFNTTLTNLTASKIAYPPSNPSNWSPVPSNLQDSSDQSISRIKNLEARTAFTTPFNGSAPQFPNNDDNVGSALYYLGDQNLLRKSEITALTNTVNNLNITGEVNISLSLLYYTNPASFMNNVTTGEGALNNIVGELLVQNDQITSLTTQVNALTSVQQEYLVLNFGRFGNPTISSTQCTFAVDLSSGVQYITGSSIFQRGNGTLYFNGSFPQGFLFHFSSKISYTSTSNNASIMYIQSTININGVPVTIINDLRPSELTTGSMNVEFTTPLFLTSGDTISMTVAWFIQSSTISYTDCTIAPSMQHPFFKFSPFTVIGQTPVLTPSLSYASGAGTSSAYQNYYAYFTLTTVDQTETPIYSPSAVVAGALTVGSNAFNVSCSTLGNGTYNCTYLTTVSGAGVLAMTVNGVAIRSSPMPVTVISSVHAPFCSLSSSTTEPVGPIIWTFTMLDINAQPVLHFHDNFIFQITNSYIVGGTIFQQQFPGVGQLAFYAPTYGTMEFRVDVINDVNTLTMAGTPSFTNFS